MSIFQAERHEKLTEAPWTEARARSALHRILEDTLRDFGPDSLWPIHPMDRSPERPDDSMKPMYFGAAGVIWALVHLSEMGATNVSLVDFAPVAHALSRRHQKDLENNELLRNYLGPAIASFQMGETGMHFVEWKLAPSAELADAIFTGLEKTIGDSRGLLWGSAGSMLAALHMHSATSEQRWEDLYLRMFNALWTQMKRTDDGKSWLWTHDLYGVTTDRRLGALHGFAANACPMIRGVHLLANGPQKRELLQRVCSTLRATALRENGLTNWPDYRGLPFEQYCNGAPGIIVSLGSSMGDPESSFEDDLLSAGELVWVAGPLTKLPVLCHGTAGNGFALLRLYVRTGDEKWLHRARRFAMHAIHQNELALEKYEGRRKYSLWTGDLGLAIFLWNCIKGTAHFPVVDVL
jgi:hypothetical protein